MLDFKLQNENIFNPIEGHLDKVIEGFVEFYGEKNREVVTNRIKNTDMIFLNNLDPNDSIAYYTEFYDTKCANLELDAFKKVTGLEDVYSLNFSFKNLNTLKESIKNDTISVNEFCDVAFLANTFNLKEIKSLSGEISYVDVISWASDPINKIDICAAIDKLLVYWEINHKQKYESLQSDKRKIMDLFIKLKNKQESNYDKLYETLEGFTKEYLQKVTKSKNEAFLDVHKKTLLALIEKGEKDFLKFSFNVTPVDLENIQLFNFLGSKHKDNINHYKADNKLFNKIFNKELKDKINDEKYKYNCKLFGEDKFFKATVEDIKNLKIKNGDKFYVESVFDYIFNAGNMFAYMIPCLRENDEYKPIIFCKESYISTLSVFVHELNHAVSSNLIRINKEEYKYKVGIKGTQNFPFSFEDYNDITQIYTSLDDMSLKEDDDRMDDCEPFDTVMLNEVLNDYMAIKISQILNTKQQLNVFKAEIFSSSYSCAFSAFDNFLETHLDKLKDIYIDTNPNALQEYVGKANFKILSQIATRIILDDKGLNYTKIVQEIALKKGLSPDEANIKFILDNYRELVEGDTVWSDEVLDLYEMYKTVDDITEEVVLKEQKREIKKLKKAITNDEKALKQIDSPVYDNLYRVEKQPSKKLNSKTNNVTPLEITQPELSK